MNPSDTLPNSFVMDHSINDTDHFYLQAAAGLKSFCAAPAANEETNLNIFGPQSPIDEGDVSRSSPGRSQDPQSPQNNQVLVT